MNDELMTVKTIAKRLMCSVAHVYALVDAGELACFKIGLRSQGGIRVSEEQLQAYLKRKERGGQSPAPKPPSKVKLQHLE
jgi:excisionase family DNA binding protein